MYKRILIVGIALVVTMLACIAPVGAKVHLIHYNYNAHGQAWYDYLVDRAKIFNVQNPDIEVEVIQATSSEYVTKFTVMMAGGTPPDVTDFHPALGSTQIVNGTFTDLRPYLAKDNINLRQATSPAVMQVLTTNNGAIWGLPADIFPVVTFYNQDIFDKAGLPYPKDLGANWTWEQALIAGRKTTFDANADGTPDQWGFDRMWARWYMWVHQAGGQLYDRIMAPTKSLWNTSAVIKGLNFPITIQQEGLGPKANTPNVAQTYFWFGHMAMSLVDGPGSIGAYLKTASFRWDIAPQVKGPVNAGTEITVGAFEMVDAGTHKPEAWKWMKFISLDVESHAKFVELTGRAPSLAVLQRRYQQLCKYLPSNFMAFFDAAAAPGTQLNYLLLQQSQINAVVNPTILKIFNGDVPVETAVQQIHEQVTAIFESK